MNYLTQQLLNAEEINLIKKDLEDETQNWEDGKNCWQSRLNGKKQFAIKQRIGNIKKTLQFNQKENPFQSSNKKLCLTKNNSWNNVYKIIK